MPNLALWVVEGDQPTPVADHGIYERTLEDWIERQPSLVHEGIRWVGRQRRLPGGGILDLLGVTPEGQWVVAELKAGPVNMATLNQALGYATEIGAMDGEDLLSKLDTEKHPDLGQYLSPRNLALLLVGTSQAPDLERGIRFLQEQGLRIPIRIVTFGMFRQSNGAVFLARQVEERESPTDARQGGGRERVLELAQGFGVEDELTETLRVAERLGLPVKVWPACFTVNSPVNKRKTLLYVGPREGGCHVGYAASAYAEAFGVTTVEVESALGSNWKTLPKLEVMPWLKRAEDLTKAAMERTSTALVTPSARA